ncbi:MAG: PhzF family phenazine biosynthesis protein [Halioglobus sp.]
MQYPIYQVDAFADAAFSGNPAAVMPLTQWLDDITLQRIAAENNLSETAFLVPRGADFELRWFTPEVEVDLCGHATLASAHALFEHMDYSAEAVVFHTRSGPLTVSRADAMLVMDFPAPTLLPLAVDTAISQALGAVAVDAAIPDSNPSMMVYAFESQAEVAALTPDFRALLNGSEYAVIATAPGDQHDFVSRFFGPQVGIDEDPVTGSAHCCLTRYWAGRLGKSVLSARQISPRGGEVGCELRGDRVVLKGRAITYMTGTVTL